jgi:hypothetical protein
MRQINFGLIFAFGDCDEHVVYALCIRDGCKRRSNLR